MVGMAGLCVKKQCGENNVRGVIRSVTIENISRAFLIALKFVIMIIVITNLSAIKKLLL